MIDDQLRRASLKACKNGIPDDVVYWKVIGAQWNHQQNLPLNEPLPREEGFLERNQPPYPEGTTLLLRRQGAEGDAATEVLVDLRAAKERASAQRKDKYEDFKKAETTYYLRHQYFVEGLTGRARHIYDGIFNDDTLLAQYNRRSSWQRTNFVYFLIHRELYTTKRRETLKGRYHRLTQREGQTNRSYIHTLETLRRELNKFGFAIAPEDLGHKLLDSLNTTNAHHAMYLPSTHKTLREIKDFLYDVDEKEAQKARLGKRNATGQGGQRTKTTDGSFIPASKTQKPENFATPMPTEEQEPQHWDKFARKTSSHTSLGSQ